MKENPLLSSNFSEMKEVDFAGMVYQAVANDTLASSLEVLRRKMTEDIDNQNYEGFSQSYETFLRIDNAFLNLGIDEDYRLLAGTPPDKSDYHIKQQFPQAFSKANAILKDLYHIDKGYDEHKTNKLEHAISSAESRSTKWTEYISDISSQLTFAYPEANEYSYWVADEFYRKSLDEPFRVHRFAQDGFDFPDSDNITIKDKWFFDNFIGYRRDGGQDTLRLINGNFFVVGKPDYRIDMPPNFEWLHNTLINRDKPIISLSELGKGELIKDHKLKTEEFDFPTASILSSPSQEIRELSKKVSFEREMLTLTNPIKLDDNSYSVLVAFRNTEFNASSAYLSKRVHMTEYEFKNTFISLKPSSYNLKIPVNKAIENNILTEKDGHKFKTRHIHQIGLKL